MEVNNNWRSLDVTPPDKTKLELMDAIGKTAFGFATWYPFRSESMGGGIYNVKITHCEPYWDGGFMVDVSDLEMNKIGQVAFWRTAIN